MTFSPGTFCEVCNVERWVRIYGTTQICEHCWYNVYTDPTDDRLDFWEEAGPMVMRR